MTRLKKLHLTESSGMETPFGNLSSFPSGMMLKQFFLDCQEEFPDYSSFDFDYEIICNKEGQCSYQWYLIGEKD